MKIENCLFILIIQINHIIYNKYHIIVFTYFIHNLYSPGLIFGFVYETFYFYWISSRSCHRLLPLRNAPSFHLCFHVISSYFIKCSMVVHHMNFHLSLITALIIVINWSIIYFSYRSEHHLHH